MTNTPRPPVGEDAAALSPAIPPLAHRVTIKQPTAAQPVPCPWGGGVL